MVSSPLLLDMKNIQLVYLCASWFRVRINSVLAVTLLVALSACTELGGTVNPTSDSRQPSTAELARQADPGLLLLLVPEGQQMSNPMLTAWFDAASEIGIRIQTVTDKQFKKMGMAAQNYAGLILPDQLHAVADDALLKSIRDYTQAGGQTLLVYDFGTLTLDGNSRPTYPIPKSRLSDLAGVDYALHHTLREKSTAVGSIAATRSTLRELQVPPGKSSPYIAPGSQASGTATVADSTAGGSQNSNAPGNFLSLNNAQLPREAVASSPAEAPQASDALESYSGYLLGNLVYSSFVTQGSFAGTTLATSAEAGLVAGLHKVGRGQVLFVNLPLTYLKVARTDGLLMHGFLRYFAHNVLQMAHLSAVPNAVAGLTLNWHLDSFAAQQPTFNLEKMGVFEEGPFSIHMTTGPDAVTIGDGKGWNLNSNPQARQILQRFAHEGHAVGSHGGWNHDYYG